MEQQPNHFLGPEGENEQPREFDWQTYGSMRTSQITLDYQGWDEHGVYPDEEKMLNRSVAELRGKVTELGEPPTYLECEGSGEIYRDSENQFGERIYDEHPTGCWCCGGSGEYQKSEDADPKEETAPHIHLEMDYEDRFSAWDDDPSPYDGTCSEE